MKQQNIFQVIDAVQKSTSQLSIRKSQQEVYFRNYDAIRCYCRDNKLDEFDYETAIVFYHANHEGLKLLADRALKKAAITVARYWETGEFNWSYVTLSTYRLSKEHQDILNNYKTYLSGKLGEGTIRTELVISRQFLIYVEKHDEVEASNISVDTALNFIRQEAPNHPNSRAKLIRSVRKFTSFLCERNLACIDIQRLPIKAGKSRQKALPCFTNEEIDLIFAQIDRSTIYGKRNFAIFLIAVRLGARASDIAKLKLEEIDWHNNRIQIIQKKTGAALHMPIPIDVGNAIADYILHGRVKCDNPYVFQRINMPEIAEPLDSSDFNSILQRYMQSAGMPKSGWDGKTFHAFRRTAGTKMVVAGAPVTTVAQVLGHANMESTKRYISLDVDRIRSCCLSLGDMLTYREGLQ